MEALWLDARHAARGLAKNRGFAAVAIVTLALGIGATTAIFSVVNAVLLRPLPYPDADRLVRVAERMPTFRPGSGPAAAPVAMTAGTFQAWRDSATTLDGIAAYQQRSYTLTGLGEPIRLRGTAVSTSMFPMLRVTPEKGRLFTAGEERPGADQVAILSDGVWTRRFNRDPGVVGRSIMLDDKPVTVVGILPASFYFPDRETEIWTPMTIDIAPPRPGMRMILAFSGIARLKDGVAVSQAEAEGTAVAQRIQAGLMRGLSTRDLPPSGIRLVPLQDAIVANVRPALLVLLGAVGFVLLIASANIANLLLARGAARQRELAVRTALGARRTRLVRQLLTESVMLALIGGSAGVLLAYGLQHALPAAAPANIPRMDEVRLDARVLAFACVLSILTGLVFGLAPAVQGSRANVLGTLSAAGVPRTGGFRLRKGNRLRSLLVIAEVALSIVLLTGAGLLVRSFIRLIDVKPGYDPANVITAQVALPQTRYPSGPVQSAFFDQLRDRAAAIPGVRAVGTTDALPLSPGSNILTFGIEGEPPPADPADMPRASLRLVGGDYAAAMGLQLVAGRVLDARDIGGRPSAAMVNESLAHRYFAGASAVGKRLQMGPSGPIEIVGVVADVRHTGLDAEPQPEVYIPFAQMPAGLRFGSARGMSLVVRSAGDPLGLVSFLRQALLEIDGDVPLDNVMTMEARLSASVAGPRFYALLLASFAGLALLLAAVGIYGVLSYNVCQRSRDIGVRMALGAERRDIMGLVVGQGLVLTGVGIAIGIVGALGATRFLRTLLFGTTTTDPMTYAGMTILLGVVAFVACWIPARRATRLDPMAALRHD